MLSLDMTDFFLTERMKHNMVQRQTVKFILFDKIVILLTTSITIYLQLNLSLPTYLQAFAESYEAQVL